MESLKDNWLSEGLVDFEYKKYIVLAYLKSIRKNFGEKKLYPFFSDLVFHYKNLLKVRSNKDIIYDSFPKEISKADFQKLKLSYKKMIDDDELMKELEEIVLYAIPQFEIAMNEGKEIYDLVEENIELEPVGISPLSNDEGYIFLSEVKTTDLKVFNYKLTIFESVNEKFRGINITFLEKVTKGIGNTYESIKLNIVKKYKHLPNPATYLIHSKLPCPFEETLFPIAKRIFLKHLSQAA